MDKAPLNETRLVKFLAGPTALPYLGRAFSTDELLTFHTCNIVVIKDISLHFSIVTTDYITLKSLFGLDCDITLEEARKMHMGRFRIHMH